MKIEAVIVCKDYSDFLEHTLPHNIQYLDHVVIVTHPDDKKTKTLCDKLSVDFIDTELFHENGDKFNKAKGINLGLSHLRHSDWLLHIDADILLPHRFRDLLFKHKLNKEFIYGADRFNTKSYDNWMNNKHKIVPHHAWRFMINPIKEFQLGSRLLHNEHGYCPIGYFQLWHSSRHRKYPINAGSAEHSDVLFAVQWPREKRILIPEVFVYHLESDPNAPMGANWNGRKTPHFGPQSHSKLKPGGYIINEKQ